MCAENFWKIYSYLQSSDSDPAEAKVQVETDAVNASFAAIGISPLKFAKISRRDSPAYAKRKLRQTQDELTELLTS